MILDEATAVREWTEANALATEQMKTHLTVIGETTGAVTVFGEAGVEAMKAQGAAVDAVTEGYRQMQSAAGGAFQAAVPQGFSYTQAYRDAGFFVHDAPFLGKTIFDDPNYSGRATLGYLPREAAVRGAVSPYGVATSSLVNVNMNGLMMTDNPASQANVERMVKDAVFAGIQNSRKF